MVILLLGAAVFVSTVPRIDLPETSFNEADAPVNLAPAARPTIRLVPPAVDPIMILPSLFVTRAAQIPSSLAAESAAMPAHRHGHSLQDLLCTFLI
jgi:hypothetical protein